jgi:hypothetical protein
MPNASTNTVEAPLALAAARHNINLDVLVTSAFLRSLPQLGEVVLATIPQSIIAILARAAGANVTYVMNKKLCDQHGLAFFEASKAAGVEPVCFDTSPMNVELQPKVQAGFEGLGVLPQRLGITTPDRYLSSRVKVSWLALDKLSLSILEVAEYTVQQHKPLISGFVSPENADDVVK